VSSIILFFQKPACAGFFVLIEAMMAGQAILAIAPEDSDLVDLIKAADCGWFVEPGDVAGLAKVIDAICADAEGVLEKRENAFQYAHAHLGQDALAKDWARALRGCAE